jgi:hypothetical protein
MSINLNPISTFGPGIFDEGAQEINAFDPINDRLFVINSNATTIDIYDLSDPSIPSLLGSIDASAFGGGANSVAVSNGLVAVAIEANTSTDNG